MGLWGGTGDGDGGWEQGSGTGLGSWGLVFQGNAVSGKKYEFARLAVTNMMKSQPR